MNQKFATVITLMLGITAGSATAMEQTQSFVDLSQDPSLGAPTDLPPTLLAKGKAVLPTAIGIALIGDGFNGLWSGRPGIWIADKLKQTFKMESVSQKLKNQSEGYQKAAQNRPKTHYLKQTLKLVSGAFMCWYASHVYNTGSFVKPGMRLLSLDSDSLLKNFQESIATRLYPISQEFQEHNSKKGTWNLLTSNALLTNTYLYGYNLLSWPILQKMQVDEVFKKQALWKVFKTLIPEKELPAEVAQALLNINDDKNTTRFLERLATHINWSNKIDLNLWLHLNQNILTFNDGTSCPQGVFVYLYNILITVPVNRKIAGSNEGILRSIAGYMIRPLLARS